MGPSWELWKYPRKETEGICLCPASRARRERGKPKTGLSSVPFICTTLFRLGKIFEIMEFDRSPSTAEATKPKLMERKAQLKQEEIQELCRR